jgi:hypothetical protein
MTLDSLSNQFISSEFMITVRSNPHFLARDLDSLNILPYCQGLHEISPLSETHRRTNIRLVPLPRLHICSFNLSAARLRRISKFISHSSTKTFRLFEDLHRQPSMYLLQQPCNPGVGLARHACLGAAIGTAVGESSGSNLGAGENGERREVSLSRRRWIPRRRNRQRPFRNLGSHLDQITHSNHEERDMFT